MIVNMKELLAGVDGYGVAAINVVDFTSMKSVVAAAERLRSPLIIQTSPKTVKHWSIDEMALWFEFLCKKVAVPCVMHLDHCTDFDLIEAYAKGGWTSVMYDGSALPFEENLVNTKSDQAPDFMALTHP